MLSIIRECRTCVLLVLEKRCTPKLESINPDLRAICYQANLRCAHRRGARRPVRTSRPNTRRKAMISILNRESADNGGVSIYCFMRLISFSSQNQAGAHAAREARSENANQYSFFITFFSLFLWFLCFFLHPLTARMPVTQL